MINRIKLNNLKFKRGSAFRNKKKWIIGLLGLLGITLIWQGFRFVNFGSSVADLPDYAATMKRADWNEYTKIGQAMGEIMKGWDHPQNPLLKEQTSQFELKITEESLETQTSQIKQLFAEEEAFRKADLDKTLGLYRNKLNQEMEREIDLRTFRLKTDYQKEITNREFNIKNSIAKYNEELKSEYQVTLANLQLQLLLVDLSNRVKEPTLEKQKIQGQIDKIHQEMYDKISMRQQELTEELAQYKKQRMMTLDSEIKGIRTQSAQSVESALSKYRNLLEADFYQWRQQRQQDIQMVINLRQSRL